MYYKIILLFFLFISCGNEYSVVEPAAVIVEEIQPTEVVIQSLTQPYDSEQLDVLVILDTSCSMSDNFEQVSRGIEILREDIESITYDYKIGFINSSLKEDYFSGPYDVMSTSIDLLLAPYELADDTYEIAFSALYGFVTTTTEAEEFFREDADKLLIFVSDEDEQSGITARIMHEWIESRYKDVQRDVVAIIVTKNGECESPYNIGESFIDLVAYYGKTGIDICSDWEAWLADSTFLAGPIDYVNLDYVPVEESIVVYIDKVAIEEWYYLPSTNTVYLDYPPFEGSLIEVGYVVYE